MIDYLKPLLLLPMAVLLIVPQPASLSQPPSRTQNSSNAKTIRTDVVSCTGSISQLLITTSIKASPQTLNPVTGNKFQSSSEQMVQIKMEIPDLFRNATVHYDNIRLNGYSIPLRERQEEVPKIGPKYVHLFFDRAQVINILGAPAGDRVIFVELTFGGGHLFTGSDVIKLLPAK